MRQAMTVVGIRWMSHAADAGHDLFAAAAAVDAAVVVGGDGRNADGGCGSSS